MEKPHDARGRSPLAERRKGLLLSATFLLLCACGGSGSGSGTQAGSPAPGGHAYTRHLYAALAGATATDKGQLACFGIRDDGTLEADGKALETGPYPFAVAASPDGRYLFVANQGGADADASMGSVSSYCLGAGGRPVAAPGSPYPAGTFTESVTVDPTSTFVYAANAGNGPAGKSLSGWQIAPDGSLTALAGFPFKLDPSPMVLCSANLGSTPFLHVASANKLQVFGIGAAGTVTPLSGGTTCSFGAPYGLVVDRGGFAFVVGSSNVVSPFLIDDQPWTFKANGGNQQVAADVPGATALVEDLTHLFLFAADEGGDRILALPRAPGGKISTVGSVVTAGVGSPYKLALHPDDTCLYVAGQYGTLRVMKINPDGRLVEIQKLDLERSALGLVTVSR